MSWQSVKGTLLFCFAGLTAMPALASDYPERNIRLVAPFSPGGALDLIARSVGQQLNEQWKQPVIVDNRAGAAGIIGTEAVARAAPDGYTILMGVTTTHGINPSLYTKLPYDAVKDFAPVSLVATIPHVLIVNPRLPVHNLNEFVAYAKANPGLNYGSAGLGSPHHLAGELMKEQFKIDIQHVPYKGAGPAMLAVMSGEADFMSIEVTAAKPHILGGKLRPVALAAAKRLADMDVATFAESGAPGFEVTSWYAVFAPAKTPAAVLDKLNAGVVAAVNSNAVREKLSSLGALPIGSSRQELGQYIEREIARWAVAVKTSGARVD